MKLVDQQKIFGCLLGFQKALIHLRIIGVDSRFMMRRHGDVTKIGGGMIPDIGRISGTGIKAAAQQQQGCQHHR